MTARWVKRFLAALPPGAASPRLIEELTAAVAAALAGGPRPAVEAGFRAELARLRAFREIANHVGRELR